MSRTTRTGTPPVPSLRDLLRTILTRAGAMALGFLLVTAVALLVLPGTGAAAGASSPSADRGSELAADRAAQVADLVRRHGCWSGPAPSGVGVPGHAVVTLPDQEPRLVDSRVGFDIWLEGAPGVLHAFCR